MICSLLVWALMLLIAACSINADPAPIPSDRNELEERIADHIVQKENSSDLSHFQIVFNETFDEESLLMFTFVLNRKEYEGLAHMDGDHILFTDYTQIDATQAITVHQFAATLGKRTAGDEGRPYLMISGILNDPDISELVLTFHDGQSENIKRLGRAKSYCYVKLDQISGIKEITAYNSEQDVIFRRK